MRRSSKVAVVRGAQEAATKRSSSAVLPCGRGQPSQRCRKTRTTLRALQTTLHCTQVSTVCSRSEGGHFDAATSMRSAASRGARQIRYKELQRSFHARYTKDSDASPRACAASSLRVQSAARPLWISGFAEASCAPSSPLASRHGHHPCHRAPARALACSLGQLDAP